VFSKALFRARLPVISEYINPNVILLRAKPHHHLGPVYIFFHAEINGFPSAPEAPCFREVSDPAPVLRQKQQGLLLPDEY
jgi:hypothetical protein